jgi:hypothetical protein
MLEHMFDPPATLRQIREQHSALAALCSSLDPTLLPDHEVPAAFEALAAMQKAVEGATVRMAARYDEVGSWKRNGARSAEDDIARRTGTSPSKAKRSLRTSRRLGKLSRVDRALRRGELSPEQADEVSAGAEASPEDEGDLLDSARREPLHALRRRSARSRAKADTDREARRARQHRLRRLKRWLDDDGLYNLLLKLPPEMGSEIDAALKPRIDRAYADARDAGRFEDYEAYAADVAHRRLIGDDGDAPSGTRRSQAVRPDKKVIALVDVAALQRGDLHPGETCEIAGVGPVSVSAVRRLLGDATLALVIKDGVDVLNVTHLGRSVTAHQRTALEARGPRCEREGCGSTHHLDIDHMEGWALTHTTRLDDLAWCCGHCHTLKTRHGYRWAGPPGARHFVDDDGRRVDGHDPPGRARHGPAHDVAQDELFTLAR